MLFLQKYLTNFQKLFLSKRRERWLLWLKTSSAQILWFCNSNVTTFPTSRKCKNFNFSLYTVPAEMLYLQKYLTNFQKLFLSIRRERWLLWLKTSRAPIFWFCNSNVTTFPKSRKCKNFNFSIYTVPAEMLYLQKYFTNFLKVFLPERRGISLLWFKISRAQIFWFCSSNAATFPTSSKCKNFNFSLLHCPSRNAISPERI